MDGYKRISSRDVKTCPACWALDGKTYPLDDRFGSHPNCRCYLVPALKSWAEVMGDPSLSDTREDVGSGEEAFAALPAATQEQILGPSGIAAYRAGSPLSSFAVEKVDPVWGPTVSTRLASDSRATIHAGNIAPPVAVKTFRSSDQVLEELYQALGPQKDAYIRRGFLMGEDGRLTEEINHLARTGHRAADPDQAKKQRSKAQRDRTKVRKELDAINQELGTSITFGGTETHLKLLDVLKARDPIQVTPIFDDQVTLASPRYTKWSDIGQGLAKKYLEKFSSFFESRPFTPGTDGKPLDPDVLNQVVLVRDFAGSSNVLGHCSYNGRGQVMVSTKGLWSNEDFEKDLGSDNTVGRTFAHEMTHWLDARDSNLRKATEAFFRARTAGDSWEPSPYGGKYKPDKWPDAYCGQRYDWNENGGYEIPTRGVEYLLSDPIAFAQSDPEYFKFIWEVVVQGAEWNP